jgi:hypothetical protein
MVHVPRYTCVHVDECTCIRRIEKTRECAMYFLSACPSVLIVVRYVFMLSMSLLMINIFLAIVLDAYIVVKGRSKAHDNVLVDIANQVKAGLRATRRPKGVWSNRDVVERMAPWFQPDPPTPPTSGGGRGAGAAGAAGGRETVPLGGGFVATEEDLMRVMRVHLVQKAVRERARVTLSPTMTSPAGTGGVARGHHISSSSTTTTSASSTSDTTNNKNINNSDAATRRSVRKLLRVDEDDDETGDNGEVDVEADTIDRYEVDLRAVARSIMHHHGDDPSALRRRRMSLNPISGSSGSSSNNNNNNSTSNSSTGSSTSSSGSGSSSSSSASKRSFRPTVVVPTGGKEDVQVVVPPDEDQRKRI